MAGRYEIMTTATITTRLLRGFNDPSFCQAEWERLLAVGQSDVVFLTHEWQSAWWASFGRGELLLIAAERDGEVVALAPLFTEAGMVYFVGSGGSDYLNFIGDVRESEILDALLGEAKRRVPGFIGFVFYHVPDDSETGRHLEAAAARLGLQFLDEGDLPAPALDIAAKREIALAAANKKSLVRHERFFTRDGLLKISHLSRGEEILPHLEAFFEQHRRRWAATPHPSLFCDAAQQRFYRAVTSAAAKAGWLRFTRLDWQDRAIAFHFGFCYRGNFFWYKPSFALELARHSPGEVLLRQLLLAAIAEGAHTFDFGLGDEAFKSRFATRVNRVRTWGLYNPKALARDPARTATSLVP
ncbi:MAG TPA: GNAT family N-acetyltransferase [Candidatus Acidoferrales bacterium]|nr:GNAT family N-acetyltransferase [Candidatus Acidoferrales bacterium]